MTLSAQRCLNHLDREAVARCPECTRFFCRECVVEHEDRIICATCLARLTAAPAETKKARRMVAVLPVARGVLGVFAAWLVFYVIGRLLLEVPDDFHASTLWDTAAWLRGDLLRTP